MTDAMPAPPVNLEAEQALLGALMVSNAAYQRVADFLRPEHFSEPVHTRIFEAIGRLLDQGRTASPITLKGLFEKDEALANIGGAKYLVRLATSVVTVANADDYARVVADLHTRRELLTIALDTAADAASEDLDRPADARIEEAERRLGDLAEQRTEGRGFVHISIPAEEALRQAERAYQNRGKLVGVTTGLLDLDKFLGGLNAGDLVVLASRPSMGKTVLAGTIARAAAETSATAAIFELEMSSEQLSQRFLAAPTGISADRQRKGDVIKDEWLVLSDAKDDLSRLPIFIDDTPAMSVTRIRQRARRIQRRHGLGIVIVDHLQLMRQGGRIENRRLEIGEITGGLKALAKELGVPVLVLSQLSRAVEMREDKRPMVSDLRESGDIEQDADVIMFLYREEYYLLRSEPRQREAEDDDKFAKRQATWGDQKRKAANKAEIIIPKNRHGRAGVVRVQFDAERSTFNDLAQGELL